MKLLCAALFLITVSSATPATAQAQLDNLFELVVAGAECKQSLNNGLMCDYRVGKKLRFAIKDAGGSDELIGFRHSDINDDFYAVMYFGCIVVVPGLATKNYGKDDNVYVSPKNGRVYRKKEECQIAK